MPAAPHRHERIDTPPFTAPFLQTPAPMQRETLRPDQLTSRAQACLVERFGSSDRGVEAAFAHGAAGLLSGHTHYTDGFGLLMSFPQGTAVAVREAAAPHSRITFEGSDTRWVFDDDGEETDWPAWACLVREIARALRKTDTRVDVAVASTVRPGCMEAYLAALGVATARALQALFAEPTGPTELVATISRIIGDCIGLPFSAAYAMAAEAGRPQHFTLVDTATIEQLPLEAPPPGQLGWGLVDVGGGELEKASVHWSQREKAEKALAVLQKRGFEQLTSFRDLDHQELQRALSLLPRRLRPVVRHLVAENHRVHRMVFATRNKDWQMLGALLLISHASLRDDWKGTSEEVDLVVEHVEAMSLDGMYGATVSGRGGCVLVVGQPFAVPRCLDRIRAAFEERFDRQPETMLL